jgi:hypothetical protein
MTMGEALNTSPFPEISAEQTCLIVFTRYPEPGKTKTRLIPALGADGAAALQKQMTEHTLATIRQVKRQGLSVMVDVRFAGGNPSLMQAWLGLQWDYTPQGEGDLGDRLSRAFQDAFSRGATSVLAIGIDCPDITAEILAEAISRLELTDMVLGPAEDGGYYLIGLSRFIPEVFQDIDWGTENVRRQTLDWVKRLGLDAAQLSVLADVDRPEDVQIWERAFATSPLQHTPKLSVVIPVLNEAQQIGRQLRHLIAVGDYDQHVEIIVADGGSQDETVAIARSFDVSIVASAPGRAAQMNVAAHAASGDVLLFLHADTTLPQNFPALIAETLARPNVIAGAFELAIQGTNPALRGVEWGVRVRSHLFQMPYGDQAIFLKRTTFEAMGGFSDLPIMEDFELMQRLKKQGKVAIAPATVTTSGRRWEKLGVLKTTLLNQTVIMGYRLGISPTRLARWYQGNRL